METFEHWIQLAEDITTMLIMSKWCVTLSCTRTVMTTTWPVIVCSVHLERFVLVVELLCGSFSVSGITRSLRFWLMTSSSLFVRLQHLHFTLMKFSNCILVYHVIAFSGQEHPACKKWVTRCWHGYLYGVRCMVQLVPLPPHCLLFHKNLDRFYLLVPAYPVCPGEEPIKWVCVWYTLWVWNIVFNNIWIWIL